MKRNISVFLVIAALLTLLAGCGGKSGSVVGTWVVKEYDFQDEVVPKDRITDYLGELSAQYNKWQLDFTSNGNLVITSPNFQGGDVKKQKVSYSVQDGNIEIFDPDDPSDFELIEYDGKNIRIDMGGFVMVMKKK